MGRVHLCTIARNRENNGQQKNQKAQEDKYGFMDTK